MDTYTQPMTTKRQYRSVDEKRRIVQEALAEGVSVALVARAHGVNANLVFNWRKLYRAGRLGGVGGVSAGQFLASVSSGTSLVPTSISTPLLLRRIRPELLDLRFQLLDLSLLRLDRFNQ